MRLLWTHVPQIGIAALVVGLGIALVGCDGGGAPAPLTFGGVEVTARGDATLSTQGGELVVSGLSGTRTGGFAVNAASMGRPLTQLDVILHPVDLPEVGARIGVVVEDAAGVPVASLFHERIALPGRPATGRLRFAFPEGTIRAVVRYKRQGEVILTLPLDLQPGAGRLTQEADAGESDTRTESVHVIRSGDGRWIVVSDAQATGSRGGCAGYLIRLPVPLPDTFPDGTLCADWVEVEPVGGPVLAAARTAVVGRGVGTFRVRTLAAAYRAGNLR